MSLIESEIRAALPKTKSYSLSDGRGLILDIKPGGQKYWFARYWQNKKEHRKALGSWPAMPLKEARAQNAALKEKIKNGAAESGKFGEIAEAWFALLKKKVSPSYAKSIRMRLDKYILPTFGSMALDKVKPSQIIAMCTKCQDVDMTDTSKRLRQIMNQIYTYAIASDFQLVNPAACIAPALEPHVQTHYPCPTDDADVAALIRDVRAYGRSVTRMAMELLSLTVARPGNICAAEWSEFNLENKIWHIPAEKMKTKVEHDIPLSKQTIEVLKKLEAYTGESRWLFPSVRDKSRHMSDGAIRLALRSMGYGKDEMDPHAFRAIFSTIANRYEINKDVIESQLAHKDSDAIRRAYNREVYWSHRIKLMQWYADYLDAIVTGTKKPAKPVIKLK